jgi:TRAP transporter TAXI family solute receptor
MMGKYGKMKMIRRLAIAAAASVGLATGLTTGALAQTIGLATTQGGATEQIATAIAKTVTQSVGLQVRPQVLANTSQYIPLVDSGRVELGIANYPQTYYAIKGEGMSEGRPAPNLKVVGLLIPFNAGLMVPTKLGIEAVADLKGKRVPRFPPNSLGDYIIKASLESAHLTYNDVVSVPTANFPTQFNAFKDGAIDVTIATVGAQVTYEFATLLGGVGFLRYGKDAEATLAKSLPGTTLKPVGDYKTPGVKPDTVVFAYDYVLFANASVPNDVVAKVAKALYEGEASLKASGPIWNEFRPKGLGKGGVLEYHPGAIEFYKSVGAWSGK